MHDTYTRTRYTRWMDGWMDWAAHRTGLLSHARTKAGSQLASRTYVRAGERISPVQQRRTYLVAAGKTSRALSLSLSLVSRGSIVGGARTHARTHAQECDHTILGSHMLINSWCTHALDEAAYTNTQGHVS